MEMETETEAGIEMEMEMELAKEYPQGLNCGWKSKRGTNESQPCHFWGVSFFAFQGTRADPARFGHDDRQDLCGG